MELEQAVRTRRTVKAFGPQAVDRATLRSCWSSRAGPQPQSDEPLALQGRWSQALGRLKQAAGGTGRGRRAAGRRRRRGRPRGRGQAGPRSDARRVLCEALDDPVQDEEDRLAAACSAYIVLLGAHARGPSRRRVATPDAPLS